MKRKLISTLEATPAGKQIVKPCSDCPWARDAVNGWLGGNTDHEWIIMAHGETFIPCHVHPDVQCAGAAIYRANVGKLPRDPSLLVLPTDTKLVFGGPQEFLAHHAETPERKLRARLDATRRHMRLSDLQDGQTVRARWGRAGRTNVRWCKWTDVPLHVQRHKGEILLVALKGVDWAEYGPSDYNAKDNTFLVEDYYLEIEGLTA